MMEMPLEKETVLAEDRPGTILNLSSPQSPVGCDRNGSTLYMSPVGIGGPVFMSSTVLSELPSNAVPALLDEGESEGVGVKDVGKSLHIHNGLQIPAGLQPQPQRPGKRRCSMNTTFKHPASGSGKRRRRAISVCDPVLPSNFLLGGNIFDPLNLNSLLDEEVNRVLNAETPKSSPLPTKNREPVEILIPRDITDPLNLSGRGGNVDSGILVSPIKNSCRRRHRNRHHGAANSGASGQVNSANMGENGTLSFPAKCLAEVSVQPDLDLHLHTVEESPQPYELNTSINCRDDVVPPVLPRRRLHSSVGYSSQSQATSSSSTNSTQPHKLHRRRRTTSRSERLSITPTPTAPRPGTGRSQTFHTPVVSGATAPNSCAGTSHRTQNQSKPRRKYKYGAYSHYYGYQAPDLEPDPRLAFFRPEWFRGKKVLDVGCNAGHVTLAIARRWGPAHILGLDINSRLVHAARQNLRHVLSEQQGQERLVEDNSETGTGGVMNSEGTASRKHSTGATGKELQRLFPMSFRLCRGPIAAPPLMPPAPGLFPNNVFFMKGNYVAESEVTVMSQRPEFDVILCLSVTKWVHLHWGDVGVQRLFKRAYRHLTPGGALILEAQPWCSYSKRKRLSERTYKNYNSIRLKPDQFSSYLTAEVGFTSYEIISPPSSCSKGLQRPLYLFHKGPAYNRR